MAETKKAGLWDDIKNALKKSTAGKPEKDDDPDKLSEDLTNDDIYDDDYEDASEIVKSLTEKIANLEETIDVMAKAQTVMLERMEESDVLQKSIGQGILAVMERQDEVLASPTPRKGVVTQLETTLAKAINAGAATGTGGAVGGGLKPFTQKTIDMTKDILTKAVSNGEIDIFTCGKFETQMNKSVGKAAFAFSDDFVEFMKKHVN